MRASEYHLRALKERETPRIPRPPFGDGDSAEWVYAVALMSKEESSSSGVRRIRDIEAFSRQWRIGGADGSISATLTMDLLRPERGVQESMLSDFVSVSTGSIDDLADDDFAQITPIVNP